MEPSHGDAGSHRTGDHRQLAPQVAEHGVDLDRFPHVPSLQRDGRPGRIKSPGPIQNASHHGGEQRRLTVDQLMWEDVK
jgi:hypothetical protein